MNFSIRFRKAAQLVALLFTCKEMSLAGTILIGSPGDGPNSAPFGANAMNRYQQVYSASLFTGPVQISAITFFYTIATVCGSGPCTGNLGGALYAFSFSTTSQAVNALNTNLSNNVGADQQLFFQGAPSATIPLGSSYTFVGTPFLYDPPGAICCWTSSPWPQQPVPRVATPFSTY